MIIRLSICCALTLSGCDRGERVEAPTAIETERLNEAETMLDNMAGNEEGPATEVTDPSNRSN